MDYHKHYDRLIERARDRAVVYCYVESHHVVPRCMGGSNDESNLVLLTPEEHYVAHQLLVKMHPENTNLVYAAHMMAINAGSQPRNNKMYGWLRRRYSKVVSENMLGKPKTEEHKQNISKALTGKSKSKEHVQKMRERTVGNDIWTGKKRPEHSALMKARGIKPPIGAHKGYKHSEESKQKMREAALRRHRD